MRNQQTRRRYFLLLLLPLLLALLSMLPHHMQAQTDERCFPETGYCISGNIRAYWEANGGLAVFGYPTTPLRVETIEGTWSGPVQWFERDRLEDHTADGEGVLAGRLGALVLELDGTPWYTFPQVESAPQGCEFFAATGHTMCEPFAAYWHQHGGLERFGYPITEAQEMTIGAWSGKVQYFERRRMEHHLEHVGTQYEILLGLLGNEVQQELNSIEPTTPTPTATTTPDEECETSVMPELQSAYERLSSSMHERMGCPFDSYRERPAATQNFERGFMLWADFSSGPNPTGDLRLIYALIGESLHRTYTDTWETGEDPDTPEGFTPPSDGLYAPRRGFGKVWANDPVLRQQIGWAIERLENTDTVTAQLFEQGAIILLHSSNMVYVFGTNEWDTEIFPYNE